MGDFDDEGIRPKEKKPELFTFGNAANRLTPNIGDANTMIPESKAFMVNIFRKGVAKWLKKWSSSMYRNVSDAAVVRLPASSGMSCRLDNDKQRHLSESTRPSAKYLDPGSLSGGVRKSDGVKWLFRKDGCMHCTDATCVNLCPAGARFRLDSGAIGTDDEKCVGCQSCVVACPFGKPRYSEESNKAYKCKLCNERIANNLQPACVKACPTGALQYGDKDKCSHWLTSG